MRSDVESTSRRRSLGILRPAMMLLAIVAAAGAGAVRAAPMSAASRVLPAQAATTCRNNELILLQGLATDSSSAQAYFGDIEAAVQGQVSYSSYVNFSYSLTNRQSYTQQDSLQSLSQDVEALHRTVGGLIGQCDGVRIDLVGHSMGGMVALRYLATYGPRTAEGAHIRHLITLDSPLGGISSDEVSDYVAAASLLGIDLSSLLTSPGVQDLVTAYNDPGTPQKNLNLAQSLAGGVVVRTFGSDGDLIVPYSSAAIPGFASEWELGTISNLCPTYPDACVGHNQILHDPGVLTEIVNDLRSSPSGTTSG